jgi:hypothetical protein
MKRRFKPDRGKDLCLVLYIFLSVCPCAEMADWGAALALSKCTASRRQPTFVYLWAPRIHTEQEEADQNLKEDSEWMFPVKLSVRNYTSNLVSLSDGNMSYFQLSFMLKRWACILSNFERKAYSKY